MDEEIHWRLVGNYLFTKRDGGGFYLYAREDVSDEEHIVPLYLGPLRWRDETWCYVVDMAPEFSSTALSRAMIHNLTGNDEITLRLYSRLRHKLDATFSAHSHESSFVIPRQSVAEYLCVISEDDTDIVSNPRLKGIVYDADYYLP